VIEEFKSILTTLKEALGSLPCPVVLEDFRAEAHNVVVLSILSHETNRHETPMEAEVALVVREKNKGEISFQLEKRLNDILEYNTSKATVSISGFKDKGRYEELENDLYVRTFVVSLFCELS
jgi:cobalamin biosynthesis protein CobT